VEFISIIILHVPSIKVQDKYAKKIVYLTNVIAILIVKARKHARVESAVVLAGNHVRETRQHLHVILQLVDAFVEEMTKITMVCLMMQ
jgi:hypothetical protein